LVLNPRCELVCLGESKFEVRARVGDIDLATLFFVDEPTPSPKIVDTRRAFKASAWFEYLMEHNTEKKEEKKTKEIIVEEKEEKKEENVSNDFPKTDVEAPVPKEEEKTDTCLSFVSDFVYKSWLGLWGVGRPRPTARESRDAWFIRSSRPPIIYASALGSLLIVLVFAIYLLSLRFRRFGRIANELKSIASSLSAETFPRTRRQLWNYANMLETIEQDFNASWQAGGIIGAIFSLATAGTYVPLFDVAVRRATIGKYRRTRALHGENFPSSAEKVAFGANLLGIYISVSLLIFVLVSLILTVIIMCFTNDYIRRILWDYRTLGYSYIVCYFAKAYLLQPTLFHYFASDGYLIKRDVPFYLCNIAWIAYGVFVGATAALVRALLYMAWSVVATADLGHCLLPSSIQFLDYAHLSYTAAIHLHHHHHNTIANKFADNLLQQSVAEEASNGKEASNDKETSENNKETSNKEAPSNRRRFLPRNRWHLAYTLIHNPKLRLERRFPKQLSEQ